jgi:hypothetical protein
MKPRAPATPDLSQSLRDCDVNRPEWSANVFELDVAKLSREKGIGQDWTQFKDLAT